MTSIYPLGALAAAWLAFGVLLGLAYFALLRRTVGYFAGGRGRLLPVALTLARLAAAIGFFGWAALAGALPVLAAFLGFLGARGLALRAVRRLV